MNLHFPSDTLVSKFLISCLFYLYLLLGDLIMLWNTGLVISLSLSSAQGHLFSKLHSFLPHLNPFQHCTCHMLAIVIIRTTTTMATLNISTTAFARNYNLHFSTTGMVLPKQLTWESEECDTKKINTHSLNFSNSLAAVPVEIAYILLKTRNANSSIIIERVPVCNNLPLAPSSLY